MELKIMYEDMTPYRKIVVFEQLYASTHLHVINNINVNELIKQKLWLRMIGLIETWDITR